MSKQQVSDEVMQEWLRPRGSRAIRRDFRKYAGDTGRAKRDMLAALLRDFIAAT